MRRLILALALALPSAPRAAEDGALVRLLSLEEMRPWAAVGRVNIAGNGFCTGTLIAPDKVLTAAHCLFFPRTGTPVPAEEVHFLAGYRSGSFLAHRKVRRYAVHRDWHPGDADSNARLRADVAVLELESPVAANAVLPFERALRPRDGEPVAVVSYARDRAHAPSIQEPCHVLAVQRPVLVLSCAVNFGSSGAPVFVRSDARPRVAALISAMATHEGRKVALAIDLAGMLDDVLQDLATSDARARTVRPGTPMSDLTAEAPGLRKVSRPPARP